MSLPTLLKQDTILPQKWMTTQQKHQLKTRTSIEWIIEYLEDRSWNKTQRPKIRIKGPGSRVGIFRSGTGTGKSTVFPPAIFNKFFEERQLKKTIICTQPTVATATDIPYQIALYNANLVLGENIGFQTGSLVKKPVKGILFATIGILLQHLKLLTDDEFMKKYSFIILDEIHNRSVETDTTLFYLHRFLERNFEDPQCPFLILTSGTFEPEIFMNYFSCPNDAFLDIIGSSFPVKDHFTNFNVSDYMTYAVDLAEKIHVDNIADITEESAFRDILIFVQGGGQIKDIVDRIHKLNTQVFSLGIEAAKKHSEEQQAKYVKGGREKLEIQTYYLCPVAVTSANMQKGETDYQNTFSAIETVSVPIYKFDDAGVRTETVIRTVPASRRVIVATNAIETGITIDSLKYCIDTGYVQESQHNPNFGVRALISKAVTQSSARQRRGRVGRKDPGEFYACYTKETYDALIPLPFPEIIKSEITIALLDVIINETETKLIEVPREDYGKYPNAFQMNQFDQRWYSVDQQKPFDLASLIFIQSPAADSYAYSIEKLRVLGFIDSDYSITTLGWFGSKFRKVDIESIRMILAGYHNGANVIDLITITCFLQVGHKLGIKKNKYHPRNPLQMPEAEVQLYYNLLFGDEFVEYIFIWNDFMEFIESIGDELHKSIKGTARVREEYVEPVDLFKATGGAKSPRSSKSPRGSKSAPKLNKAAPKLNKAAPKLNKYDLVKHVHKWCEDNSFDPDEILRIVEHRDELIGDMLNLGLNPFYNGLGLTRGKYNLNKILQTNIVEGMEEVRKIKKCIYDGYRMNLYLWNDGIKSYVSPISHNTITLDSRIVKGVGNFTSSDIKQTKPQKIIVSAAALRSSQTQPGMYEFFGSDVSILDGFVDIDLEFLDQF